MFNKNGGNGNDCALVMGTISTVSALEKQQQVKLEAYSPQKKQLNI